MQPLKQLVSRGRRIHVPRAFMGLFLICMFCACTFSFCTVNIQQLTDECNKFHVTSLWGLPDGPVTVNFSGGGPLSPFNVLLIGGDSTTSSPLALGGIVLNQQGATSATFPIDGKQASGIVAHKGWFEAIVTASDPVVGGTCVSNLIINVADMVSTGNTATPTQAPIQPGNEANPPTQSSHPHATHPPATAVPTTSSSGTEPVT